METERGVGGGGVIRVRKHDTLVPGWICLFLSACVSVSELHDRQGCVPKLPLSDLNAAKQPDKPLFFCPFFFF